MPSAPSPSHPATVAAVEAGGTSFVVAICRVTTASPSAGLPEIVARHQVDSSHQSADGPAKTLAECCDFLSKHRPGDGYHALAIASFGPLGVSPDRAEEYGRVLQSSPKAQWRNVDLLTPLRAACEGRGAGARELRVRVDTDVNAPAMAEHLLSDDRTISSLAYVTVGTGIGVGLVVNNKPVHGRMHPEGGHVPVQPLDGDTFGGYSWGSGCPFKGRNTVEGLTSSVALTERFQQLVGDTAGGNSASDRNVLAELPDDHEVWYHAANALACLCATLLLTLSMEKIVLGGGLMKRRGLLEKVRERTAVLLNGYLVLPEMEEVVVTSRFGSDSGLVGTIVLAQMALMDDGAGTGDVDTMEEKEETKAMKQAVYNTGLWHGMLVGALGAALVCKYAVMGSGRRR